MIEKSQENQESNANKITAAHPQPHRFYETTIRMVEASTVAKNRSTSEITRIYKQENPLKGVFLIIHLWIHKNHLSSYHYAYLEKKFNNYSIPYNLVFLIARAHIHTDTHTHRERERERERERTVLNLYRHTAKPRQYNL